MKEKTGILSLTLTAVSVVAYLMVTCLRFGDAMKWWIFGFHLVMTAAGLVTGLIAIVLRQWWGLVSLAACGYLLKIQFTA